jgi:hypothetical protein
VARRAGRSIAESETGALRWAYTQVGCGSALEGAITAMEQVPDVQSCMTIVNRFSHRLRFIVEPWANEFWMEPGETFEIVAHGPANGSLELAFGPESIVVFGWSGSLVAVYTDGERLDWPGDSDQPRVPLLPRRSVK